METNLAQVEPFLDMFAFVKEQINVSAIILFGFRARGIAKEHNDYDFIIVGDFSEPDLERSDWFLEKFLHYLWIYFVIHLKNLKCFSQRIL